ncbi:hypothetical protein ACFOU2_22240 [Bacillus songklensis]|uniref:Uncharacterized protein n=1 Tax=Bacillus songklensis TaxID=1069116 RepID=A0ABV8BA80_9BACI
MIENSFPYAGVQALFFEEQVTIIKPNQTIFQIATALRIICECRYYL